MGKSIFLLIFISSLYGSFIYADNGHSNTFPEYSAYSDLSPRKPFYSLVYESENIDAENLENLETLPDWAENMIVSAFINRTKGTSVAQEGRAYSHGNRDRNFYTNPLSCGSISMIDSRVGFSAEYPRRSDGNVPSRSFVIELEDHEGSSYYSLTSIKQVSGENKVIVQQLYRLGRLARSERVSCGESMMIIEDSKLTFVGTNGSVCPSLDEPKVQDYSIFKVECQL